MDDDLLNPININLDDYEDEALAKDEGSVKTEAKAQEKSVPAEKAVANPVPDPDELDRLLSGAPADNAAPQAPNAPMPAPEAPPAKKSGVPPLPDFGSNSAPNSAPNSDGGIPPLTQAVAPQTQQVPSGANEVTENVSDSSDNADDDVIVESGDGDDDDHIRPIDVMAPSASPSQFGAPPLAADVPVMGGSGNEGASAAPADVPAPKQPEATDEKPEVKGSVNRVSLGEEINLTRMDPGLKRVLIGMGWDAKVFSDDSTPDLDVSLFLLNKDNMTRENEDFVFYNNMEACEGGVQHHGDNRTGAGDGDDENITIKLSDLPFDIVAMDIVLTIYQGLEKEQSFKDVENIFFRLVNADTKIELLRLELDTVVGAEKAIGVKIGRFNRIGPNWFFEASATPVPKGLSECAREYGIVVAEML